MNRDDWVKWVVEKDRQYIRNGPLLPMMMAKYVPILTQHVYDAKPFRSQALAEKIAKKVGGKVRTFDALNGEVR